ncbi:MAG: hypothetical protein ACYDHX_02755 [Methanothrix sp.]
MQRATWLQPARQRQPEILYFFFSNCQESAISLQLASNGIFAETLKAKYLDIKDIDAFIDSVVKA